MMRDTARKHNDIRSDYYYIIYNIAVVMVVLKYGGKNIIDESSRGVCVQNNNIHIGRARATDADVGCFGGDDVE